MIVWSPVLLSSLDDLVFIGNTCRGAASQMIWSKIIFFEANKYKNGKDKTTALGFSWLPQFISLSLSFSSLFLLRFLLIYVRAG